MNSYFELRDDQKKMVITQTANKIGLPVQEMGNAVICTPVML